jgi:hypothetical protein
VVAAMVDWRYLVPAAGIQVASLSTYLGYLHDKPVMPLQAAAAFASVAGLAATALLVLSLRAEPSRDRP